MNEDWLFDFDVYLPTKEINLQRPMVWTLKQKQKFIELIIKNRVNTFSPPIPPIFIIQYKDTNKNNAYIINVWQTKIVSDEDKIRLFEMINWTWTPQDLEHIENLKK